MSLRPTPWITREEWRLVYHKCFSSSKEEKKWAADRIAVWKCRQPRKLAASVEMTGDLLRADLSIVPGRGNQETRMLLSTAVIRFINVMTDCVRYNQLSRPVHHLAKEIGIPEWIVDLRHEATHGNLPEIQLLTNALHYCLDWIRINYWEKEAAQQIPQVSFPLQQQSGSKVSQLLVDFQQERFAIFTSSTQTNRSPRKSKPVNRSPSKTTSSSSATITKLRNCLTGSPDARLLLLSLLCDEGYLAMTNEQLLALGLTPNLPIQLPYTDLPKLLEFWEPLIHLIHACGCTSRLVHKLSSKINELVYIEAWNVTNHIVLLIEWTIIILRGLFQDNAMIKLEPSIHVDWSPLLSLLFQQPHEHSLYIFKNIKPFVKPHVGNTKLRDIKLLLKSFLMSQTDTNIVGDDSYSIHSLQEERVDRKWKPCTNSSLFLHLPVGLSQDMLSLGEDVGHYFDIEVDEKLGNEEEAVIDSPSSDDMEVATTPTLDASKSDLSQTSAGNVSMCTDSLSSNEMLSIVNSIGII